MDNSYYKKIFERLHTKDAVKKAKEQNKSVELLFETFPELKLAPHQLPSGNHYKNLRELLGDETPIFDLNPVQREIYHSDSGTAFVPEGMKKMLLNIKSRFVVRPLSLEELHKIVQYCKEKKLRYTLRGAGTWPFGGVVPMNNEIIIDLAYLDFYDIIENENLLVAAPGLIFANIKKILRDKGFDLCQEITNTHSGTLCGWISTGGLGLGAYKYGHVKNSVKAILLLTPNGDRKIISKEDELFNYLFGSEGQLGIIAGVILEIKKQSYVSKPYAFSFPDSKDAQQFMKLINEWKLKPTSVLYFDPDYIGTTKEISRQKIQRELENALKSNDELIVERLRKEMETIVQFDYLEHVVVLEFDTKDDYQKALKFSPFVSGLDERRYQQITFKKLSVLVAHKLWEHRYLPVEMKQHGPSMLVSETIQPLEKFTDYLNFVRTAITFWTQNPVKTEAHLINPHEVLIQTIILADPGVRRHIFYLGLVPFITQSSLNHGGKPYGVGIWNLPFQRSHLKGEAKKHFRHLLKLKIELDPKHLVNQCKYINNRGRKITLRVFKRGSEILLPKWVSLLKKGKEANKKFSLYTIGKIVWAGSKSIIPLLIPPKAKAQRNNILNITVPCAECDSCERVCPTSTVFGLYGIGTPITRRVTANRLAHGKKISQVETLGFLVCTRCDNCTRVCPTDIQLTNLFNVVENDQNFQAVLKLNETEKDDFIDRFWNVIKDSPLYKEYTLSEIKEEKSHLDHGLKIHYAKGFAYAKLFIDPETCIHCGMCAHDNACTYNAREGRPREIPILKEENCSLCNACINYCPQNKVIQNDREYVSQLIDHALDMEEKKYWNNKYKYLRDTTIIQRSTDLTEMADIYVTEDILMEIDKEASTGNIPVSGMGQGDRHMGIGFDAERFSHFHIVGPAQNRLHEGDPDEELSIILGKRHRYCKFDNKGNMHNPPFPKIKLKTPILYNHIRLDSNGRVELALIKVAENQNSLVVIKLHRLLEYYDFIKDEGGYTQLPPVIIPRVDHELIHHLIVNPHTQRDFLLALWHMPVFEITYHENMKQTIDYIKQSVHSQDLNIPLFSGYLEISEYEMIGDLIILPVIKEKIDQFLECGVDIIHIHGLRNKDNYFVTSGAVRAVHHYLLETDRRHEVSLIASGGIRLASDSQKTVQRGAEATLIDMAALLALDPYTYKATIEDQTTTEKISFLDIEWAVQRLNNQMESRKVQILEVLGAAGFKDLKKTVGEEGRLIDFYELEEKIQKNIFEDEQIIEKYENINNDLKHKEDLSGIPVMKYKNLKDQVVPLKKPHDFYKLSEVNQTVYQRDHVWPGWVIESLGKMASGDPAMFYLKNVKGTGLLGDGFDVMKILYKRDPDNIPESELNDINTSVLLDKDLAICAPWMFGGKSVGSIGLDTWKSHVIASKELGLQFDTGEGGYPTCFFLNRKGEPIFISEPDMQTIKPFFKHNKKYTIREIMEAIQQNGINDNTHPEVFTAFQKYPELQSFLFFNVIDAEDEPYVSTELKTGLFGVNKETIKKARRVVIAYSQGAKMGIGGHILAQKVNKLVSYLRGIEGVENLNREKIEQLAKRIEKIEQKADHQLHGVAVEALPHILEAQDNGEIFPELKQQIWNIQQKAYDLNEINQIDHIEFEQILHLCEEIVSYSYTSIISPFPFHNCYSIEDVKAFIDIVRMINPEAVVSVKVSPSVDIEFIAAGLARIAKDNTEEALRLLRNDKNTGNVDEKEFIKKYGMTIEVWLDGPRGGTGASPNIIKGQMGMHIEYAIPLIHRRLVNDGIRNFVKFFVSGGIRTYEDVIKSVALGADGVIWGTAPLVAIGCDRNRNCHDGCSRGIATSNLIMQKLRDVEINSKQIVNVFVIMQMQLIRALAGLGFKDIRNLRGRFDKIQWLGLKERVDFRIRQKKEFLESEKEVQELEHIPGQTNCGVAAIIGSENIPSHILDQALLSMKNRGMDGVGVGKTMCFMEYPDYYAYRILVKGILQPEMETFISGKINPEIHDKELIQKAREDLINYRCSLAEKIKKIFLEPYFDFTGDQSIEKIREIYKKDQNGEERDYREFGNVDTDPGDIFRFFVRVKKDVLNSFIENQILNTTRYAYIREYFPEINLENYTKNNHFIQKAEDLFVFDHSIYLSQALYVWTVKPEFWENFLRNNPAVNGNVEVFINENPLSLDNINLYGEIYLFLLREYFWQYRYTEHKEKYIPNAQKIATVISAGKNFGIWKTAGREIPWETPAAPNNIIHVRLATGSIVEQMNAHPFAKLHTALTHNGETTNYETLRQRVEQFGLPPLATTDTEVASLKFHLVADELDYPEWAMFESFSPTTGDDLALVKPELRKDLEEVQRVEFTSSPDGPYQYLCLRHKPHEKMTERVDLKDPADLRPSTTAFWHDKSNGRLRTFSMIASEEQAIQRMLDLLDKDGLIDGAEADHVIVSNGMISRYHYNDNGKIYNAEYIDRYGQKMEFSDSGKHYSFSRTPLQKPDNIKALTNQINENLNRLQLYIMEQIEDWDFNTFRWVLEYISSNVVPEDIKKTIAAFTHIIDYLRTANTGSKAKSSLLDVTKKILYDLLGRLSKIDPDSFYNLDINLNSIADAVLDDSKTLVLNATDFQAEGTNPQYSLTSLLSAAYQKGWRHFILYKVGGQRLISTAAMGTGSTDDVTIDVYGIPGEYLGAFMQGGTIRVHGNSQNFTAMCMHHGNLQVFGNAGKVCGYASKGGKVFILGNINDRAWTNSVNDSRVQNLQVHILGSASKYAGESLMGGDFFFGGLYFDSRGRLRTQDRPYRGTKLLGGASRGRMLFFNPNDSLHQKQYIHGKVEKIENNEWPYWQEMIEETLTFAGIKILKDGDNKCFTANEKKFRILPENFTLITAKGGLKGYESH